jgi:ABC-2 type transport system ATP-binding protein
MSVIELDGVTKRFGDVVAVDDLSFEVERGEVFGFLGPNGAGKSTTINMILDFVRPTAGEISVLGMDAREESEAIRARSGVLPEGYDVYDRLTGYQHLEFAIETKDADSDPSELLERVGLSEDEGKRKAGGYSKGMAQRLVLAMAIVGEPDLLILDEPSTGLDPNGARLMRDIVREESDRGATVFFSSHILGQVESVCDRVLILQEGDVVAVDSVEGLRSATDADTTLLVTVGQSDRELAADAVRGLDAVSSVTTDDDQVVVNLDGEAKMGVLNAIEDEGIDVENFETREASLEDLFAAYTEEDAQEVEA